MIIIKYLHLIPNEKFTQPYMDFINKHFDSSEHLFTITGGVSEDKIKILEKENIFKMSKTLKDIILLSKKMHETEKIYLHGLFNPHLVILLFLQFWLLNKCNWIIWGGDLYMYNERAASLKSKLYERVRAFVIRRMGGFITQVKGDYELARLWYGAEGKYHYCFAYPSNLFKEYDLSKVNKEREKIYIQVGNSADADNNHLEAFSKLSVFKDENVEIICPLSYGPVDYRDSIIEKGFEIFGEKFNPIIDFMPFEKYLELLAKVDIAVFNHGRQQALGNIITLLGLGKKVYIRDNITTWEFCNLHDLKVYNLNQDLDGFLKKIEVKTSQQNANNIKEKFSEEKLISDWKLIFQ